MATETFPPIAIIGLAGRFPQAPDKEAFWVNLQDERESRLPVPADRWDVEAHYHPAPGKRGTTYGRWGGFLADINRFDAAFFDIYPNEAQRLDPQQRLALEEAWHTLEDAGYAGEDLARKTVGVFIGARSGDYHVPWLNDPLELDPPLLMGEDTSMIAARIAYALDLHGLSLTVNTACTSVGTALYLACQSLHRGECEMTLVGGAYVMTTPQRFIMHSRSGLLSPSGHCRAFDDAADGLTLGEAVGFLMIKPLTQAVRDGDHIYATIRAIGVNQNGTTRGITSPNAAAQAHLIEKVMCLADLLPEHISYIEAHGAGTRKGDASELQALTKAYSALPGPRPRCPIGSVKTNVGHTITASVLPSLFKVALSLKNEVLPASLNYQAPNRLAGLADSPFFVNTARRPWKRTNEAPRYAAINAFAYTGANVHLILEEAPTVETMARKTTQPWRLPFSAKTPTSLKKQVHQFEQWFGRQAETIDLGHVAYTLVKGRRRFAHGVVFCAATRRELLDALRGPWPAADDAAQDTLQFDGGDFHRTPLPTYCFEGEHHRLAKAAPAPVTPVKNSTAAKTLLVFSRRDDVFQDLKTLIGPDTPIVLVKPAKRFRQLGPTIFQINPDSPQDIDRLIEVFKSQVRGEVQIVHLWNHDSARIDFVYHDDIDHCLKLVERGFVLGPLLLQHLEDALIQRGIQGRCFSFIHGEGVDLQAHLSLTTAMTAPYPTRLIRFPQRLEDTAALSRRIIHEVSEPLRQEFVDPNAEWTWSDTGTYLVFDKADVLTTELKRLLKAYRPNVMITPVDVAMPQGAFVEGVIFVQQPCDVMSLADQWRRLLRLDYQFKDHPIRQFLIVACASSQDWYRAFADFVKLRNNLVARGRRQGRSIANWFKPGKLRDWVERHARKSAMDEASCSGEHKKPARHDDFGEELKQIVADTLKVAPSSVVLDAQIDGLAFDSLTITEITQRINRRYGTDLSPTVFFEQQTLRRVFEAFATTYRGTEPLINRSRSLTKTQTHDHTTPSHTKEERDDVAVIGMHGVFPQSEDLMAFWKHLEAADDLITEVPRNRWDTSGGVSMWGGFIDGIDRFDAAFFGISPREAALMDPQQRLLLQVVWHTLEMAGYRASDLKGSDTAVYMGVSTNDYQTLLTRAQTRPEPHLFSGNTASILANRISYLFDLHGPSEPVDTACSSSLVAIHRAVQAIRQGHANLAIAGGVNLMLAPDLHSAFQEAGMLSPDGRCRTFDQNAKGYVRAEGCATVLLKPLNLAMQEGDTIYAIVKGSAVNHGGAVKSLTVPNPNAQAEVIVKAYRDARIDPATVALIETHGTGTVLGDPIEVTGLTKAFATLYADWGLANPHHPHCRLGAVKTNIGHLEAAAGIAGLIKVILAMLAQKIPPNLHHVQRNSQIKLEDTPFALSDELVDWQVSLDRYGEPVPRRAGVSSFGFGGVNAHIVLEEGREGVKVATANMERPELFILSAKTHKRLQAYVVSWLAYLNQTHAPLSLRDLCYTLQVGREPMTARIAVIANNFVDLREKLSTIAKDSELPRDCWKSSTTSQEDVIQEILANEAGLQFLDTLIKNRDLATLARVWVGGVDVDWRRLHATPGRRLWLPTYPFDKTRYWFRESAINRTAKPTRHTVHPFQQVERYALFGLNKTLKHMGAIKTDGQLASPEELGILKKYHSLFAALGEAYQNTDELMTTSEFDSLCLQSASKVAAYYAYFNLLARCLERLPEVLTGRIPPLEILFPEGSTQLVEAVYRDNPDTQRLNYLLADAVAVRVRELLPQRPDKVRVLEIGAGTGATSRVILNQLAELSDRVEYHYTDIGQGFVQQAEQRLGKHYPYVRFYSLDIQDTLPARHEKAFDVVVAANVLHATRNMVTTLGHVARLLGQNGQLLLTELTKPTLFANLTFGLTEDWWAFEDPQHRCTGAPLLNLDQWRTRLAAAGFGTIEERSETWQDDPLGQVMIRSQLAAGGAPKIEAEERDYEVLLDHLRQLFHRVTRVPLAQLSEEANFDQFGIDSLLSLQIIAALRQDLGPLPETLLYQENSLAKLTAYLLKHHERRLRHLWESIQPVERAVGQPAITRPATHAITPPTIHEGIAIIGLAGRYPMAENLDQFWENLVRGRDCVTKVPESRWDYRQYPCHNGRSEAIYPWGAFLDGIDEFDPLLFGISPNEAKLMDPHERLFLQSAWTAMEDAGYCRQQLMANASNAIGVFVGMSYNNYQLWAAEQWAWGRLNAFSSQIVSVANRVSYQLNLNGPSIPVDTACSSSLTAVHLACESLHRGECHTAIAGGVNLSLHPSKYYYLAAHGYLSPTGRCHAFGDKADGMVPGEGVGAVVLKPLNKAVEDGDHIYAIIRGSSCNHGGKVSGYTVPNPHAQATLIKDAFRKARIESSAISYVEAHGTGTALGDPVEIAGLSEAFENYPHGPGTCAIGSVKSNLGHLEAAAGIAQLTKVILQLEHRLLVPSLHAERLNPHIEFHSTPFRVQKTLADWKPPRAGMPLCVGISSFGAGGVNTHLIVEEYSQEKLGRRVEISPPSYALVLSAQSKLQLKAYAMAFLDWVKQDQTCSLTSITYTLQTGRDAMKRRLALVVSNREDIIAGLQAFVDGTACSNLFVGQGLENGDRIPDPSVMSLDQLARRWIDGAEVAWDKLYQGDKPEKTSLPTYPFARESYWITENVTQTQPGFASARPDHLFHEKALQELICELLSEILGVSSELIDPETGFFQLGMESMQALRLKQGLEDRLGLTLPDTLVFEHPNLANLARYLAARNSSATLDKIAHSSTAPAKPNYDAVEPVAIVGMAFRFPGGIDGPESFWALLTSGRTVVSEPPIGRWHPAAYGKPPYTQRGSFLTHPVEAFDARFFHISPKEATAMDPQQRLLLELTWEALENAGQAPDQLEGSRSGVFSGITGSDYERLQDTSSIGDYFATGSMVNMAAGRVAHFFGLQGPVFAVDTACSSSLVGLHLACRSLRSKECDFALVGGASLMLSPDIFTALCEMKALAPDGCCKSFDARADGYGRGEGCAVLALRRLGDAEANGDHILAIVRGSAINHDGASSGLTVPNPLAQQALIKAALLDAQVSSNQISYVEAHGTGTALGDPIEIEALGQIYGEQRSSVLWLGSVKSSIGHLEAAAGLAGLIKTILVLNNQAIPPQANLKTLNPRLSLGAIPAKVPTTTTPWKSEGRPRLAAVSSFGFSGTNAHVILSERPKLSGSERTCQGTGQHLLVLSAKSHDALVELAGRYRAFLRETKESLDNVCYTAATGRASLRYRLALLVDSKADAITKLETECTRLEQMPTTFETPLRPSHIGIVGDGTKHPVAELVALCNGQSRVYDSAAAASKAGCRVVIDAPDNDRQILESAARLFHEGLSLKWQALYSGRSYRKTPLPTYPFQRQRFWKAPALDRGPIGKSHLIDTAVGEPFSPSVIESPLRTHIFRFTLNPDNWPEINDTHGIVHVGVYQEWLTQALVVMGSRLWVAQMTFKEPMLLTGIREIQLLISPPNGADSQTFRFFTRAAEATWTLHAKGRLMPHGILAESVDVAGIQRRCLTRLDGAAFYHQMELRGVTVGPSVRWAEVLWLGSDECLARLRTQGRDVPARAYRLGCHPGVIDTCAQLAHAVLPTDTDVGGVFMVASWEGVEWLEAWDRLPTWCYVRRKSERDDQDHFCVTIRLSADSGQILFQVNAVRLQKIADGFRKASNSNHHTVNNARGQTTDQTLRAYLRERIASVLEMEIDDIKDEHTLRELGVDSLASMQLRASIQQDWGIEAPVSEWLKDPSLAALSVLLTQSLNKGCDRAPAVMSLPDAEANSVNRFFAYHRSQPDPQVRLFCLPYGGRGASLYRGWQDAFSDKIEVYPVQLPGRENRSGEAPVRSLDRLVAQLAEALIPLLDRPFALYGHSFGALIAYRLVRFLHAETGLCANYLFVGAFTAPYLPNSWLQCCLRQLYQLGYSVVPEPTADNLELLKAILLGEEKTLVPMRDSPEFLQTVLPTLLADLSVVDSYRHQDESRVPCPITAFSGLADDRVSVAEMAAWKELTSGRFQLNTLEGDHFFLHEDQSAIKLRRRIESTLLLPGVKGEHRALRQPEAKPCS